MPVVINGSTGISGTDGTAATPALQGTDTNTGVFFPAADTIAFAEGGTEVMRINSAAQVEYVAGSAAAPTIVPAGDVNTGIFFPAADTIAFAEGGVEALRLNASGNAVFTGTVQTAGITTNHYPLVLGAGASATGTSVDFTGIPSWVRRITVMFANVSTNGGSPFLVQLGAGSIATSGYQSNGLTLQAGSTINGTSSTAGFISSQAISGTESFSGSYVYNFLGGTNFWTGGGSLVRFTATYQTHLSVGSVLLGGTLDRLRITTVNGTDAFDAGSFNIMYE
jgi:hypothetical protein